MFTMHNARRAALGAATAALAASAAFAFPFFGDWTGPTNLEALPGSSPNLNTPAVDGCASLSADRLTIAFTSNRTGNFDIYVATRPNLNSGFGNPVPLPAQINGPTNEACPTILPDRIYFSSDRDDPAYDLYVSRRIGNSWSPAMRLGPNVNTPGRLEESAATYSAGGHEIMLFSSRYPDGSDGKIYQSVDGGPKSLIIGGPNQSGSNNRPSISADGRTIYFDSDRYGTLGGPDLYFATRPVPFGAFGPAQHLTSLSSAAFDARPFISTDGQMLTFSSARPGSTSPAPDIWFAAR